jgi:predicted DCC family thiol-disulfide oxidoreductase YuxK
MKCDLHVATPPPKPLMIFDGDCNFCTLWIKRWQQATGDAVEYLPFQNPRITEQFPELPRERFETAVHLVEPDGAVYSGAEAVFRALAFNPTKRYPLRWYQQSPGFATATERCYRFVAEHRPLFSWLTRIGWGRHVEQPTYFLARWIFLRVLGGIYLVAFLSLWTQLSGLIGNNGILPAGQFISDAGKYFQAQNIGVGRFYELPTLCWLSASHGFLTFLCAAGVVLSVVLLIGLASRAVLILLWAVYLSLSLAGQTFLSFQWDTLLLETAFFAIFFAPRQWLPGLSREGPPSRLSLCLLRWLLFRLMFQSGVTKLVYGDPTWLNLTALTFHYETQPLPTWIGWYAHQLPVWFQKFSCFVMYVIEVAVPFLFFAPRRLRIVAAGATIFLQVLIGLTGNYNFFNLLTVALCLPLLDDFAVQKLIPRAARRFFTIHDSRFTIHSRPAWRSWLLVAFTTIVVLITTVEMLSNFRVNFPWPKPIVQLTRAVGPFRTLNSYGLFRVMTRPRNEIIVEGSNDGVTWLAYEFNWKPGDLKRHPGFVAPHQPRLDWQMWFAALGNYQQNPWFVNFCIRLLQGSPEVLALLDKNPFPEKPPRQIRATLYTYRFTDFVERKRTGTWWQRERLGEYLPPISLRESAATPRPE